MPQFEFDTFVSQAFWFFLVFCLLYTFVRYFVAPFAEAVHVSRSRFIEDNLKLADEFSCRAAELKKLQHKAAEKTECHVKAIHSKAIADFRIEYEAARLHLIRELDAEANKVVSEIEGLVSKFRAEQRQCCLLLAADVVCKITGKAVSAEELAALSSSVA